MKNLIKGEVIDNVVKLKSDTDTHYITMSELLNDGLIIHLIMGSATNMGGSHLIINNKIIALETNEMTDDEYKSSCISIAKEIGYSGNIDFI